MAYGQYHERCIQLRPGLSIDILNRKHSLEVGWKSRHSELLPLTFSFFLTGGLAELTEGIHDDYHYVCPGQSYVL